LNKQGVESDGGFVVQFTGRFTAEYREGSKKITVSIESGYSGGPAIMYDRSCFKKWDSALEELPNDEQARMAANFRDALEFQGLNPIED
jgi:hypothetical protein